MKSTRIFSALLLSSMIFSVVPAQSEIVPIIDLRLGGLIGGSRDGKWIEPGLAAESIMNGGSDLLVYGFGGKEKKTITSAKRTPIEDVCEDFFRIQLGIKERLGVGLGVNLNWNAMPRIPKRLSAQSPIYKAAVSAFLRNQGVPRPVAKITQAFRIDLDNDGTDEVLVTATHLNNDFGIGWKAGDYSFVILRKVTKDGVKDYLVDGNIYKRGQTDDSPPNRYLISGIADLNGDGKMEVVVYSEYYEGAGTGAFEMSGGKLELIKEVQAGCGV